MCCINSHLRGQLMWYVFIYYLLMWRWVWTQSSFTVTEQGGWWWKCSHVDKDRLCIRPGWLPVTSWAQSVWHQGKWGEAATLNSGYQLTFAFLIMAVLRALISVTVYACSQDNKQLLEQNEPLLMSAVASSIMFYATQEVNSNNVSVKI